jgi:hypothetical protein
MEVTPMADSITAEQTLPPGYIDPEHSGADRGLLEVFYAACNSEGGTADEIHLRGIRAVLAAQPAPPAEGDVSDEELLALKSWSGSTAFESDLVDICRAAIALDRSRRAPVPPAEGEVGELVDQIHQIALAWEPDACLLGNMTAEQLARAADLLKRQQQVEDLAADAVSALRYIEQSYGRLYGVGIDRVYEKADRLQPAPRSENV